MEWLEKLRNIRRSPNAASDPNYDIVNLFRFSFFAVGGLALLLASYAAYLDGTHGKTTGSALGFRVLALGLTLAAACTVCGWIVGLIFGVPRALPLPTGSAATSRVNTNLEEISDWLTKILVGVGLTQLGQLSALVESFARGANDQGFGWNQHGNLLAAAVILYFAPGGFWLGYIYTRTEVTQLFGAIDRLLSQPQLAGSAKIDVDSNGVRPPTPTQLPVDQLLLSTPLKDLTSVPQYMAWSGAQTRAHHFDQARVALRNVLVDEPDNTDAARQLYTVDRAEMLTALYQPPPAGYERAIEIGEKLALKPQAKSDAELHVWLACAYGQKFGHEPGEDVRSKVLAEIDTALAIDPRMKPRLYSYWQPAANSIDNDLASLRGDRDVERRLT